ncbi:outer membrane beta-barrel protein [Spirosoma endbachense]|uniref:Outer membrane beta-barrel protein n=1 Tax=Spirosoma endbachense TaxID=2666025 RepID=A0A6P1VUR1_9BACT|nr:outer membrane beta-barrel protein [Spirosoma endbachense]QHV95369.1 outer membrane beta-barrel protein [Spirosoma endbachense]
MKLYVLLPFAMLVTLSTPTKAQSIRGKIGGLIRDTQNRALSGATVILQERQDSTTHQAGLSDADGKFAFKSLPKGDYLLRCSYVGFQPYKSGLLSITETQPVLQLPVIILQTSTPKTLSEVVVTAKKPLVEQKIDRLIVNVDAMLTAAGSNALDVLAKSPGVMVNTNDDISLNGKRNVLVLIDDRPTYMSAQDLAAYLRSLPGGLLDKLELISNPPARYDAAGGAIINIVLKKNRATGFNGSLNLGYNQGVYGRSNNSLLLNYRTKKFNIFTNSSYSRDRNFSEETYSRYFYSDAKSLQSTILQTSRSSYTSNGWNGRIGMDYFASPKITIGILFTGSTRPKSDRLDYTSNQYTELMQLDSVSRGYINGLYQSKNTGINVNLSHKFDNRGKLLTANIDYLNFQSSTNQFSPIDTYRPDGQLAGTQERFFAIPSTVRIYAGKVDFTQPLAGKSEFSAGLKSSYVMTDTESNWLNQTGDGPVPDYGKSNHFQYTESINAAYVNLKKEWSRWGIQTGLRLENTQSKGHQLANPTTVDSTFHRSYSWLFPSLYLSYKVDKRGDNTLALSYSKRIRRPGYQQLNPFLFFRDRYSYSGGNPNLIPGYGQAIDLRYTFKQYVGVTLSYSWDKDGIDPITRVVGDQFITRPQNFYQGQSLGIIPNISFSPTSWWTVNISAVLLAIRNRGQTDGVTIDQQSNLHEVETVNQFQLSKSWSAELTGFFPGNQFFAQTKSSSIYNISAGLQKTILQGQGTLRLTVNDIFYSLVMNSQTVALNHISAFYTRQGDTRRVGFSFMYRFGKEANARKRNTVGSAEEEKQRTN